MRKQYNPDVDAVGEEFYTYNRLGALASQERMFKITGPNMFENYNAGEISAVSYFDDFVLYPNPYLVVTPSGYSKHYYAGSERIASTIGGDGLLEETIIEAHEEYQNMSNDLFANVFDWQLELINYDIPEELETYTYGINYSIKPFPYLGNYSPNTGYQLSENHLTEVSAYKEYGFVEDYVREGSVGFRSYEGTVYTFSDHIGSAAWMVVPNGTAIQHMQNLPWGEVFADQRLIDYSTRYTFSGKERDPETGFSYFGFRYLILENGFFGGVDQLSDKYPSISPYAYCANNPVMLVDPDGRDPIYDPDGNFLGTDDKGINGGNNYFIMDKNNFKQGMTQENVKNNLWDGDVSKDAQQKIWDHVAVLPFRPDADGIVDKLEGIAWAKQHPNALSNTTPYNTLYIDASKCNFGNLYTSEFDDYGTKISKPVNLYSINNTILSLINPNISSTVYALGRADIMLLDNNNRTIMILNTPSSVYDWNVGGGWIRNLAININNFIFGINPDIHGFNVNYVGVGRLVK